VLSSKIAERGAETKSSLGSCTILIDGLHLTAEWFPFLDRSELAKLELSVDRNTEA
jgi:hypothetical protein